MAKYRLERLFSNTPKQKKYTLKRKMYGFGDGVGNALNTTVNAGVDATKNIAGGALEATGRVASAMNNTGTRLAAGGVGSIAGGLAGAKVGAMTLGSVLPGIGHVAGAIGGSLVGRGLGFLTGRSAVQAVGAAGKGIQHAGENMQT